MSFKKGQKLLHLTTNKDGQPHIEIVTFKKEGNYYDDENDLDFIDVIFVEEEDIDFVYPSDIYTREQILEKFDIGFCVCQSSPPGVLLDDGTCGNCGGVVELRSDFFYEASMERRYGLRVCPECGHANRHPNNHCDKCTKYLKPIFKMMNCPRCGEVTRKGNRCDHCNCNIPMCYGIVAPRTQDCANCVHAVECIEEQKRPVSPDELGERIVRRHSLDPLCVQCYQAMEEGLTECPKCHYVFPLPVISPDEPMMETWDCPKCDRVELIIYSKCLSCGYNRDDLPFHPSHELQLPSDDLIEVAKASTKTILCPNCKQPVGDKYEHSEGDYDGISVDQWWECPDIGSEEEDQ